MGFASFNCAVSKQSIPVLGARGAKKSDSDVVLVTPKGAYRGTYDGYMRLRGKKIGKKSGLPLDPEVRGMITDVTEDMISIYLAIGHDLFGLNTIAESMSLDYFDAITTNVKLVKAKFYTWDMTFDKLESSPFCQFQGYFYDVLEQWNYPAYSAPEKKD